MLLIITLTSCSHFSGNREIIEYYNKPNDTLYLEGTVEISINGDEKCLSSGPYYLCGIKSCKPLN